MTIAIERVGPADLIRAADWNEMADAIEALDVRLAAIESGVTSGTGGNQPVITDIDPDQPPAGGVMQIIGLNFAVPATLNTVLLDGEELTGFLPGSSGELIRISIPGGLA